MSRPDVHAAVAAVVRHHRPTLNNDTKVPTWLCEGCSGPMSYRVTYPCSTMQILREFTPPTWKKALGWEKK